jgi:hypothetical protein
MAVVVANLVHLVLIARIVAQPGEPGFGSYPPPYGQALQAVWLTALAFGVVSLLRKVGSRPASIALAVGSAVSFAMTLDVPFNETIRTVALSGVGLAGLGWVLFGIDVATRRRPLTIAAPANDRR